MNTRRSSSSLRHIDPSNAQLASSETARQINRGIVLALVRANQPISRADLARLSGLQRSTVSQIVEQLIAEHWICEGSQGTAARGRRPTMLLMNDRVLVIAVDIHPQQATVAAVDLNGRLLSRALVPLTSDPHASMRSLTACMTRIRKSLPKEHFEGIGISVPGRVDPETQQLVFAPNLRWPSFDMKKQIEEEMGLEVRLENAATSCLLAELIFGNMSGIRDAVLVTVAEGIGASIYANGEFLVGKRGMAGEFGHIPIDPLGPTCACGQRGCWETFASCQATLRNYQRFTQSDATFSYTQLLQLAEEGDKDAAEALDEQARQIGRGLRMIQVALAPEVLLIAGEVVSAWTRLAPILEAELSATILGAPRPRMMPTHEGETARLRGAAALILQRQSLLSPAKRAR